MTRDKMRQSTGRGGQETKYSQRWAGNKVLYSQRWAGNKVQPEVGRKQSTARGGQETVHTTTFLLTFKAYYTEGK